MKGRYVRVKERTQRAISIITGQIQIETGATRVSADDALWRVIKIAMPDVAKRVEEEAQDKKGDET